MWLQLTRPNIRSNDGAMRVLAKTLCGHIQKLGQGLKKNFKGQFLLHIIIEFLITINIKYKCNTLC